MKNPLIMMLLISSGFVANCATRTKLPSGEVTWSAAMKSMATNLERLMPYVFGREEFHDSENKDTIRKLIAEFAVNVQHVPQHNGELLLGRDPLVRYSLTRLKNNASNALSAFEAGQLEYSRHVMRENVGLCFGCHSTQNFGPQDSFSTAFISSSFRIQPSERADYYVATRQFDKASEVLKSIVDSPVALLDNPHEQLYSLRKFLYLQVRVKNDPAPAVELLDRYLSWEKLPYFMATDARSWQDSLRSWQHEEKDRQSAVAKAKSLLKKADERQMTGYQAGLVDYLRASAILHEGLLVASTDKARAEIYELLGQSYETLAELGIWDLPEVYYEACIRTHPRSVVARDCYRKFERSMILGYSGSAGTLLPPGERKLLAELRELSGLTGGKK